MRDFFTRTISIILIGLIWLFTLTDKSLQPKYCVAAMIATTILLTPFIFSRKD